MILVFDTETTGLTLHPDASPEKQPKIIEFGGVLLDPKTGGIVHEFNKLINPREDITEEITKITGITNEMVAHEGTFEERLPFIRGIFSQATSMCAHNLPFDRDVLRWELARHRHVPESQNWPWPPLSKHHCTMNMYNQLWGRNPRLIELYESVMGRPYNQTHRALDDVKAMVEIIRKEELWRLM